MKKIIILTILLVLFVGLAQSQSVQSKIVGLRGLTSGTLFSGKAYTDALSDTSQAISVQNYRDGYVRFNALDSAGAVTVWYRPLLQGTTYGAKVTIGTVGANTNNSGVQESFALPATCLAASKFQLGVTFAGSANGVTSATYKLDVLVK